jgi:hypothetical protein
VKYFITSCNKKAGIPNNDSGDLTEYFELGWEFMMSRLYLIKLLKENKFDSDTDIVVTNSSREFLYSKFCKNVISYETFCKVKTNSDEIINLVHDINEDRHKKFCNELSLNIWYWNKNKCSFQYSKEELPEIVSFDLLNNKDIIKNENNYICIVVRKRDWCNKRGYTDEQLQKCIDYAKNKNLTVYIMGKECDTYTNTNVYHVSLQEMATLINDKNCKAFITPLSGGGMIRLFTGICPMITFDMEGIYDPTYPLLWGDGANFSGLDKNNWIIVNGFNENVLRFI